MPAVSFFRYDVDDAGPYVAVLSVEPARLNLNFLCSGQAERLIRNVLSFVVQYVSIQDNHCLVCPAAADDDTVASLLNAGLQRQYFRHRLNRHRFDVFRLDIELAGRDVLRHNGTLCDNHNLTCDERRRTQFYIDGGCQVDHDSDIFDACL